MMMLTQTETDQVDLGLFGCFDDQFYYNSSESLLCNDDTADIFSTLLEDRNLFCNSVSSSACPSVTSEVSSADFDFNFLDGELDLFCFDRLDTLTPSPPPKENLKYQKKRLKNSSPCKKIIKKNNQHMHFTKKDIKLKKSSEKKISLFKKWSTSNIDEKTNSLQSIMGLVSRKFGLREQLDVIKIINPDAKLPPSATEFFIDFDLINDDNYELVNKYVSKELKRLKESKESKNENTNKINTTSKPIQTVHSIKRKKPAADQIEHPILTNVKPEDLFKKSKQLQKEKRSGLFAKEQIVVATVKTETLEDCTEDEEEIDILT